MVEDATTQPDDEGVPDRFTVDFAGLTLLGIYEVERKLADGGMGSVYLGEDTNLGRKVVVKVPHVRFLGEAGFRRRFTREITELVRLEHPHIVRILAQGEHDSVPFFVLQFLGGGSLETRLAEVGAAIDVRTALPWFRRIAETLDFVHERNTVHRDVKPANILFDETGNVYLSDFGVAKALADNEDANLTDAGTGIGSPRYMSPEQGYGRELGPSADQYALAASLYETLSGKPPHGEGTAVELLVRKASEDPDPLASFVDEFPLAASDAIAKGMSRDPGERFPSCQSFLDAVERGFGLGTGEVTLPDAAEAPRHRVSTWIAVGLIALAAAFGFWALYDDAPQAAPVPATTVRLDQTVNLLRPGEAPLRVLRYELAEHSSPFHVHVSQDVTTAIHGGGAETPVVMESKTISDMAIPLETRTAPAGFEVTWTLADVDVSIESQNLFEQRRAEAVMAAKGTSASFILHPTGARVTEEKRAQDSVEAAREESIGQFAHDILIPLPTEAIGVGARWEVVETVEIMRLRFLQTSIYELVEIDGPVLKVRGTVSQAAPSQEIALPGGAPTQKLTSLTGGGETEAEIRLDRVAPLRRVQTLSIQMAFEMAGSQGETAADTLPRRSAKIELKARVWSGSEKYQGD